MNAAGEDPAAPESSPEPTAAPEGARATPDGVSADDLASLEARWAKDARKTQRRLAKLDERIGRRVDEAVGLLTALDRRLARIERAQREAVEATDRLRRAVRDVEASMGRRTDLKKLKKVLDQLEVVEVPDDAPDLRTERD